MLSARVNEMVDKLQTLGLTSNEAKAYLAAIRFGFCRVVEIAHETRLHRPEVYHIMSRLVSIGLVEETLDRPKRYRATPVQHAIASLTEAAMSRYKSIGEGMQDLVTQLERMQRKLETEEEGQIRVITGLDNILRNSRETLNSAQNEIWMISVGLARRSDIKFFLEKIAAKHLKCRLIMNVDENTVNRAKRLASQFEVRHYPIPSVHLYGADDRYVAMGLHQPEQTDPSRLSEIATNYPSYVMTMRLFFESTWNHAIPLNSRLAMLQGQERPSERTRIIWGRQAIIEETSDWHLKATKGLIEITTINGPHRIYARFQKAMVEARERGIKWRLLCHLCRENAAAIKNLAKISEVRLVDRPFGIGVVVLDDTEVMIHYIDPDSPDLKDYPTDLALVTTDPSVAGNMRNMLRSIWKNAKPLKTR